MAEKHDIQAIADLACLKIDGSELKTYEGHFEKVLSYFETLQKVDTNNIKPMVTPHDTYPSLREDKVQQDLNVNELLENAPEVKDGLFKVPPVV